MIDLTRRRQIRQAAHAVLVRHAVKDPPVPVRRLIEAEGLTVAEMRWGRDCAVDGLLVRNKRAIALNVDKPERRQTFSLAHELGHYLLNHDGVRMGGIARVDIDHPPDEVADPEHELEQEADEFAGELLVPKFLLERYVSKPSRVDSSGREKSFSNNPFAQLVRVRESSASPASSKQLASVFAVSEEVLFVALSKHGLL